MEMEEGGSRGARRRGCTFQKNDFFPEESFKSWGSYGIALRETPWKFKNRVMTRSKDETEVVEMKGRSSNEMKKTLNSWDLIWFGIGAVIGSGIFVITGLEARDAAGPAVVLSYVVSGISALLSVFCYTEFAVEIPVADWSFMWVICVLKGGIGRLRGVHSRRKHPPGVRNRRRHHIAVMDLLLRHPMQPPPRRVPHNNPQRESRLRPPGPHSRGGPHLIAIATLAMCSTKASSLFNNIATIVHCLVIVFIIVAGLINANPQNLTPFTPFGVRGVFKASAVLFFAFIFFAMAEETKNPARDIPIGLVGSMTITTLVYCLLSLTLCLVQSYKDIDVDAPFSVAFHAVGWDWAKYIVALGALKGMTTVLLVTIVGESRYLTHISRTHMMPPWFGLVDDKTGTPVNATIAMLTVTSVIAFFTNFRVLSSLLSISTLLIFMLVAVALLVRRYYSSGVTTKANQVKLIVCLVLIFGSSCGVSAYWANSDGIIGYVICVPLWLLGTGGLWLGVPMAKTPKLWGVPLVPWLPALSIFINIFLLGSIDVASYIRFGVWTALLLVYYAFVGLHASYDAAKELKSASSNTTTNQLDQDLNMLEQGVQSQNISTT
ncbi:Cationic amino acid transporter 1 [Glycine soja]|nr:Cationic amino acid transporter 1 [Glycine soja]